MVIQLIPTADSKAEIKTTQSTKLLHTCPVSSELNRTPLLFNCTECYVNILYFSLQKPTPLPRFLMGMSQPSCPASVLYPTFQASICQALSPLHCAFLSFHFQNSLYKVPVTVSF